MRKVLFLLALVSLAGTSVTAQSYLPLTGGNLTGTLTVSAGNQIDAPFFGFNTSFNQPSTSSVVSIFPNNTSTTIDFVGWASGWRFIPVNGSTYAAPVVTFGASGNATFNGATTIGSLTGLPASGNALLIRSPNSPASSLNYQDINYSFQNAGSARIRAYRGSSWGTYLQFLVNSESKGSDAPTVAMQIDATGNVGIGTTLAPQSLLAVKGTITAQKVVVIQTGWSDYVFDSSYRLRSLPSVENFIQMNKHLPDVPSAKEIQTEGNDLGDNQRVMLQKIEELTLYIIDQNKRLSEQNRKIEALQQEVTAIKKKQP